VTSALPAHLPFSLSPPTRAWLLALTLAIAGHPGAGALAAEAEPQVPGAAAAAAATGGDARAIAYRVVIDAPQALKDILERNLGLVRWADYAEMTGDLLDRLLAEAVDETRNLAAAEGYFAPDTHVALDRTAQPATVTLTVKPGEPARIATVRIDVSGPAATDTPAGTDAIAQLRREWALPVGDPFRQPVWSAAKERALATLQASPYAAAKIARSEAAIDPERGAADLSLALESGPPFRFGRLEISGLSKYPPSLVRNFSSIAPGEPYSDRALVNYIRRLNASGYFASVQAAIDPDTTHPDDATVNVALIEAPTKRFEGGVGYSTDVRYRTNASYRDVNFDGQGLQLLTELRLETTSQSGSVRLSQPPNSSGWIGAYTAGAARTDIAGLVTRTAYAGSRWHSLDEYDEIAGSATYYLDEQLPLGAPRLSSHATYPEVERYWRRVDNLISPRSGWMAVVQMGAGVPGLSTRGFGRVLGRLSAWLPIDRWNELQLRTEGGAVIAGGSDGIPSTLLFRTGGDNSVRGYAFESLGVQSGEAIVPGRYYAVASADAIHWMSESWGLAAFADAGNATDSLSGVHLALGYGVGARVRTPLGPVRLDLAYGKDVHKVRVHFSVGLSF